VRGLGVVGLWVVAVVVAAGLGCGREEKRQLEGRFEELLPERDECRSVAENFELWERKVGELRLDLRKVGGRLPLREPDVRSLTEGIDGLRVETTPDHGKLRVLVERGSSTARIADVVHALAEVGRVDDCTFAVPKRGPGAAGALPWELTCSAENAWMQRRPATDPPPESFWNSGLREEVLQLARETEELCGPLRGAVEEGKALQRRLERAQEAPPVTDGPWRTGLALFEELLEGDDPPLESGMISRTGEWLEVAGVPQADLMVDEIASALRATYRVEVQDAGPAMVRLRVATAAR